MPRMPADDDSDLEQLIAALRDRGINVPDEVDDLKGLVIALKANGPAAGADNDLDLADDIASAASGADAAYPAGQPMNMSATRVPGARPPRKTGPKLTPEQQHARDPLGAALRRLTGR